MRQNRHEFGEGKTSAEPPVHYRYAIAVRIMGEAPFLGITMWVSVSISPISLLSSGRIFLGHPASPWFEWTEYGTRGLPGKGRSALVTPAVLSPFKPGTCNSQPPAVVCGS